MLRTAAVLTLCNSLLPGCGTSRPPGQEHPRQYDSSSVSSTSMGSADTLTGKVFVTGSEPATSVTLVPAQGPGVTLVGDLEPELARLSGATVGVVGSRRSKPEALEVASYEVLDIDGEVPHVGVVAVADGNVRLMGKDTVELTDPPEALKHASGAKVWIVGPYSSGRLRVQSYGIIREPVGK